MTDTRSRLCMSCLRTGHHAWDCADREAPPVIRGLDQTTMDGLTVTGVMSAIEKAPETHRDARSGVPRVPVWTLAAIVSGSVLMAVGFFLNDPVARLVFEAIPR